MISYEYIYEMKLKFSVTTATEETLRTYYGFTFGLDRFGAFENGRVTTIFFRSDNPPNVANLRDRLAGIEIVSLSRITEIPRIFALDGGQNYEIVF